LSFSSFKLSAAQAMGRRQSEGIDVKVDAGSVAVIDAADCSLIQSK